MTGIRQPHHFHPLHEEDVKNKKDVKPWRLPFWTEPPGWTAEKEKKQEEVATESAEEEAEELNLPTAEELENIRREAYNDGLEQGLVEGRQQGHKDGYQAGHKESYDAGFAEGKAEGQKQGREEGHAEGLRKAQAEINNISGRLNRLIQHLQASIVERDQALPEVLAAMLAGMCEQVLQTELHSGARNIYQYVRHALDELPAGEKQIKVFVGPDDAAHLQNSLDMTGDEVHYRVDDKLRAGECRVESEHSLVEYSTADHLNQLLQRVLPMLMQEAASFPDDNEQNQLHQAIAEQTEQPDAADEINEELQQAVDAALADDTPPSPLAEDPAATDILNRAEESAEGASPETALGNIAPDSENGSESDSYNASRTASTEVPDEPQ
ncbi:MAG: hypothetical protein CMI13_03885 [Oleibacter sp.]|nr:hypothetical protein [Thalassolituus sp.]